CPRLRVSKRTSWPRLFGRDDAHSRRPRLRSRLHNAAGVCDGARGSTRALAISHRRRRVGGRARPSPVHRMAAVTRRITVVTAGHLSSCPRMLKAADAFHNAGYQVRVVSARHTEWATAADLAVRATRNWAWRVGDYGRASGWRRRLTTAARFRAAGIAARAVGAGRVALPLAIRAYSRAHDELVRTVASEPADLIYGGTTGALAAVAEAASRLGIPYGLDLEDFHSAEQDSADGELANALATRVEMATLKNAAF